MHFQKMTGFLFCLTVLFAIGCDEVPNEILDGTEPTPGLDDSVSVSPDDIPIDDTKLMGDVVIAGAGMNEPDQWRNDDYQLEDATIAGDLLTISVAYGGGCETHQFTLIASDTFMESDPVQLGISIVHNANLDFCERWVEEVYHFDLTPIKTMYQEAYQQAAGTVVLNLEGVPEDVDALIYKFVQ